MNTAARASAPNAPRILVAEPSRTLSALIRATLAELGGEIEVAPDGVQALQSARARVPDVLVCDQGLPGLDGYALAHAVKQLAGGKKVATLLLVPDHAQPDPERLEYVGIHDVLAKPFERAVLLERVRGLIGPVSPPRIDPPTAQRARPDVPPARAEVSPTARHEVSPATARPEVSAPQPYAHAVAGPSDAELEAAIARVLDQRLSQLVSQRLPPLLDAALARMLPQVVLEATQRVVAERVPGAVDNAVRATLSEVATPARIDRTVAEAAKPAIDRAIAGLHATLQPELGNAVESVKARVEGELLGRLDQFARNELPTRLTAHAEQIVWKVVPTIAEDLVKEELKRLTAE